MTIYGHFFNLIYTFLGSIFEPFYIQNRVITNRVIKRLMCIREDEVGMGAVTKATGHLLLTQPPPSVHVQYGSIIALFTEVK